LATRLLTQPIGAVFAAVGYRIGAPPAALMIAGMLLSAGTSVAALSVAADLPDMAVFDRIGLAVSLWIGCFFAGALDCADGQPSSGGSSGVGEPSRAGGQALGVEGAQIVGGGHRGKFLRLEVECGGGFGQAGPGSPVGVK